MKVNFNMIQAGFLPSATDQINKTVDYPRITGHFFARSFRSWAARKPDSVTRIATQFVKIASVTGAFERNPPCLRELDKFNHCAKYISLVWTGNYKDLRLDSLDSSLSFISTAAQAVFYREILNHGVYPMKPPTQLSTLSPDVVNKLTMSLASLEQALLDKDPMMPQHLRASHQLLISYPETVHLLDDDEIARLIGAVQVHTGIEIVKMTTPKTGGRKKITADDL